MYLLVSDIDHTLLGDDAALHRFAQFLDAERRRIRLVYASGRLRHSVMACLEATPLPQPDALISGVGSEIGVGYRFDALEAWRQQFPSSWRRERIAELLQSWDGLELQPEDCQAEYKLSYYWLQRDEADLEKLRQYLKAQGLASEVIYSSQRDLDLLPPGANKGSAARFFAEYIAAVPERVIVCGDSGNDRAMFLQGFRGVVVGNAHPELKALEGPSVYVAQREYAAGVLEGVAYWTGLQTTGETTATPSH